MGDIDTAGNDQSEDLVLYGREAFRLLPVELEDPEEYCWLRLSRAGWTPVASRDEAAEQVKAFLEIWVTVDGMGVADLPAGFGLVANRRGDVVGLARESGEVVQVRYLGAVGEPGRESPARMTVVSLQADEQLAEEPFVACHADWWAMGRPMVG